MHKKVVPAVIYGAEVRGCSLITNKKQTGQYLEVLFDVDSSNTPELAQLIDRNLEHEKGYYNKGEKGTLYISIETGSYTHVEITKFVPQDKNSEGSSDQGKE